MIRWRTRIDRLTIDEFPQIVDRALPITTEKVLGDINRYVPRDQDFLMNSPHTASNFEKGEIIYNTPYAAYQYYGVNHNFSKAKNPMAQAKWDEKAQAVHMNEWREFLRAEIMRGLT